MQHNGNFRIRFSGIGVAKSGTTWLARCLSEHPAICIATGKETNFFCIQPPEMRMFPRQGRFRGTSHYALGMKWYKSRFSHREPGQILGEFSNAYFGDPETPRLLYEHNPEMKLIVCYRDPVEATYSLFYQICEYQPIHESFEDMINRSEFLQYFRYHANTLRFLERFPREQMLLLLYEDMKVDADGEFSKVCRFLEVDDTVRPPSLRRDVNVRRVVRHKWLRDLRCRLSRTLSANNLTRAVRKGLARIGVAKPVERLFERLSTKEGVSEPMRTETREILRATFREENLRLAELASLDLGKWD